MLRELIDHLNPFFHNKPVRTSGFVFKCLTCFTVNVLVASVFMISLKQYFGEPIKCISSSKDYTSYMETKCWIEGVFLDHNIFNYTVDEAIAVGVGSPRFIDSGGRIHKTLVYQNYYQWVAPVLALEAILLFLPRLLWRSLENGVMEKLLRSADSPIMTDDWNNQVETILKFFKIKKRFHHIYVIKYLFCEIFASLMLALNMLIMQWIFSSFWTEFSPAISSLLQQDLGSFTKYSARLFPHQAKCSLQIYGPSGGLEYRDGLCFLPQNNINEKIFVFLYFWLIIAAVLAVINLCLVFLMLTFKFIRTQDIRRMSNCDRTRRSEDFCYEYSDFGVWYTLRIIHRNLNPVLFEHLMKCLLKSEDAKSLKYSYSEKLELTDEDHSPQDSSELA